MSKTLFSPREDKIHIFKPPRNVLFIIRVYKKNTPKTKSLLNCYLQNYGYQQQPTANKRTSGVHLSQFCFHMFNFVSRGGSSECFIFKWLARKNFKRKMIFFCAVSKYGMSLEI